MFCFKTKLLSTLCLSLLCVAALAPSAFADDPETRAKAIAAIQNTAHNLDPSLILPPAGIYEDGTQTRIPLSAVRELLPWASNSKSRLEDLLRSLRMTSTREAEGILLRGLRDTVLASAPKRSEILLRYTLNRAMKAVEILSQNGDNTGAVDERARVLRAAAEFGLKFYYSDLAFLNGQQSANDLDLVTLPYAVYGFQNAKFLMELDKSLTEAPAQYEIARFALALLAWDLARDQDRLKYSAPLFRLSRIQSDYPEKAPASHRECIRLLRQLKKLWFLVESELAPLLLDLEKKYPTMVFRGVPELRFSAAPSTIATLYNNFNSGDKAPQLSRRARVIIVQSGNTVKVYRGDDGQQIWSKTTDYDPMPALSPDGKTVAIKDTHMIILRNRIGDRIELYNADTGAAINKINEHELPMIRFDYSQDGSTLTSVDESGMTIATDLNSGRSSVTKTGERHYYGYWVNRLPEKRDNLNQRIFENEQLRMVLNARQITIYDKVRGALLANIEAPQDVDSSQVRAVVVSPDFRVIGYQYAEKLQLVQITEN